VSARALEFTILTAARTNEAIGAKRREIERATATWNIPGERMKAGEPHRVPLVPRALEILDAVESDESDYLFAGRRGGLSDMTMLKTLGEVWGKAGEVTVHGFRSSFDDWASECSDFPREVIEMALAHTIENQTEAGLTAMAICSRSGVSLCGHGRTIAVRRTWCRWSARRARVGPLPLAEHGR
jgi:integrase